MARIGVREGPDPLVVVQLLALRSLDWVVSLLARGRQAVP